jgi:hypothetical protein
MREQFQSEFSIENHNSVRNMSSIHRLNKTLAQIICLDYSFSFSLVDTCSRQMIFRTLTAANDGMKRQFSISNNVDEALHSSHSFRRNDTVKKRRAVTNDCRWNETHWETEMAIANGSPLIYSLYTGESRISFSLILQKMIGKYYSPLARQHRQMASSSDDAKSTRVWRCCGPDSGSAERSTRPIYIMLYLV